ncbi:MAG: alkyl hydroperoxide reductase subunit C [Candidatus Carbobacillus sp.]|nr:alkyl hydroperoxide reductase subunit C [Candidatus Carbobacillus sp.]
MSLIGKKVQPFKAQAYHNGQFIEVTDEDFRGKWSIVAFYPADFTFVCPTELEDLQEHYETFQSLGVEVYSVSTDTHFTHKAWHDTSEAIGKVKYPMIGDPNHVLSRQFDVLDEESGLAQRGTFVIDPDGTILFMEVNHDSVGRDASILVDKIKAAQYIRNHPGEACPAKWKEGEETLKPSIDLVGKI